MSLISGDNHSDNDSKKDDSKAVKDAMSRYSTDLSSEPTVQDAFKDEVDNALAEEKRANENSGADNNVETLERLVMESSETVSSSLAIQAYLGIFLYVLTLQATQYSLGFGFVVYVVLYSGPVFFLLLQLPSFLGFLLTWILRHFVIFDEQLEIGTVHLYPFIRNAELNLSIHVEDLKFGMCEGFQLEFLRVDDFKVHIRIGWSAFANLVRIGENWNPLGTVEFNTRDCPTKEEAKKLRKGHNHLLDLSLGTEAEATSTRSSEDSFRLSKDASHDDSISSLDDLSFSFDGQEPGTGHKSEENGGESAKHSRVAWLKPRLGVIHVDYLDIDGAVINFETNKKGEFLVNSFVKELAVAKTKQVLGNRPMPNTVRIHVLRARKLMQYAGATDVNARVVISARRQSRETHEVMQTVDPTFDCHFDLPLHDPSTVLHVQVWDSSFAGKSMIGQWIMTTYWLAVDPTHCRYTKGTLHVSKEAHAMRGWFPLQDSEHQHDDGSRGEILMEVEWLYTKENAVDNEPLPTSLEQLQENSAETWLRLGDTDRVMAMLETFPYKLNVQRCSLRNVHFYLGDLFAGRAGLADTGGRAKGIRVKYIELDNRIFKSRTKTVPGVSLKEFLFSYFIKGLAPKVVGSGSIVGSGLREILYSLIMGKRESFSDRIHHMVHGVTEVGEKITNIFETPSSRVMLMVKGAQGYHSKIITKDDADVFREVRLRGFLMKADKSPGKILRKFHRVEMTLQGNTLFYWRTSARDPKKREGEGRKMYLSNIIRCEVDSEGETDFVITQSDRKSRWFSMVAAPECEDQPTLTDWVRVIREQRVIMSHPKLRADAEKHERMVQEQQLAKYNTVY